MQRKIADIVKSELRAAAKGGFSLEKEEDLKVLADRISLRLTEGTTRRRSGRRTYDRLRDRVLLGS